MSSPQETRAHIDRVRVLMEIVLANLAMRALHHDASKLDEAEAPIFAEVGIKLSETVYGSEEYKKTLLELGPALEHHYAHNSHHPEHYPDRIKGMSLLDLIEMFCDWKAAGERDKGGSLAQSISLNRDRFEMDPQLVAIFYNTQAELGW